MTPSGAFCVSSLLNGDCVSHSLTALRDVRGGDEEVRFAVTPLTVDARTV